MDDRTIIYDRFETKLRKELISLATQFNMLNGRLLQSEDIDAKWDEYGRDYMIDAVHEFNSYPEVTLAWAAYLGMAVACHWDENWRKHHKNKYLSYYGARGYDDMDEHITRDILGHALDSQEARQIAAVLSACARCTLNLIRHEGFESQSVEAYYVLIRSVKVMFQIGESIELHLLGYHLEQLKQQ